MTVVAAGGAGAVRDAGLRFAEAGWVVGEAQAVDDWGGRALTAAAMRRPGGVAVVSCQAARHVATRGVRLPDGAEHVLVVTAYYDFEPPTPPAPTGG